MLNLENLMEHLKNILPTPATWLVTSSTLGITIPIAAFPGYLKEVWPELHIPEVLLFQVALISTTLFLGSFILIVLLLHHIKNNKSQAKNIREPILNAINYITSITGEVDVIKLLNELTQYYGLKNLDQRTFLTELTSMANDKLITWEGAPKHPDIGISIKIIPNTNKNA
jgi:hypothetical protein